MNSYFFKFNFRFFQRLVLTAIFIIFITSQFIFGATASEIISEEILKYNYTIAEYIPPSRPPGQNFFSWLISLGRRGKCGYFQDSMTMTALLPLQQKTEKGFKDAIGNTISSNPIVWVYIPQLPSDVSLAELTVKEQNGDNLSDYPDLVDLSKNNSSNVVRIIFPKNSISKNDVGPQIVGFSVSREGQKLIPGKFYHWYLSIICDPRRPSRNPGVDGWVQVIQAAPDLKRQIEQAKSGLELSQVYGREGIWYDMVTTLALLRCKEPQNSYFANEWDTTFKNERVGLGDVANKSIKISKCSISSK